uniref:Uncharacterized protein n=1 Tax=Globodera rostochiensis TaxID=31243 RepID=A0A914H6T7_GLORO
MPTFLFLAAICLLVAASILLETDAVGPSSSGNAEPKAGNTAHKANASDVFEAMFRFDEANAKAAAVGTAFSEEIMPVEVPDVEVDAFKAMMKRHSWLYKQRHQLKDLMENRPQKKPTVNAKLETEGISNSSPKYRQRTGKSIAASVKSATSSGEDEYSSATETGGTNANFASTSLSKSTKLPSLQKLIISLLM